MSVGEDVPPWVSVTLKEDRRSGADKVALPMTANGTYGLEQWAYALGVAVARRVGANWTNFTFHRIEPDGSLKLLGIQTTADSAALLDPRGLRFNAKAKVPPLAPSSLEWRTTVCRLVFGAGFHGAWVFGPGSEFRLDDGTSIVIEKWKDFEVHILPRCGRIRLVRNVLTIAP